MWHLLNVLWHNLCRNSFNEKRCLQRADKCLLKHCITVLYLYFSVDGVAAEWLGVPGVRKAERPGTRAVWTSGVFGVGFGTCGLGVWWNAATEHMHAGVQCICMQVCNAYACRCAMQIWKKIKWEEIKESLSHMYLMGWKQKYMQMQNHNKQHELHHRTSCTHIHNYSEHLHTYLSRVFWRGSDVFWSSLFLVWRCGRVHLKLNLLKRKKMCIIVCEKKRIIELCCESWFMPLELQSDLQCNK